MFFFEYISNIYNSFTETIKELNIDSINILNATKLAMTRAIDDLKIPINARKIYEEWAKLLNQQGANVNLIWAVYMLIIWKKNLEKINIKYC